MLARTRRTRDSCSALSAGSGYRVFVFSTPKQGFPNFSTNQGVHVAGEFRTVQQPGEGCQMLDVDDALLAHAALYRSRTAPEPTSRD